jgi:hypothetical protein
MEDMSDSGVDKASVLSSSVIRGEAIVADRRSACQSVQITLVVADWKCVAQDLRSATPKNGHLWGYDYCAEIEDKAVIRDI